MIITWYGQACFKIQAGDLVVAIDPFGKEIGLTPPRFRADVVLVTHAHPDHANASALAGDPFVISGPGEYEIKGVNITGIETFHDTLEGKERGKNTLYSIYIEAITVLHMGDFGEAELRDETIEQIGEVDIVMIPVGGTYTIDARQAEKVVRLLEPAYVIPMHYKIPGLVPPLEPVEYFAKEMGAGTSSAAEKLVIKQKDIAPDAKPELVILRPVSGATA